MSHKIAINGFGRIGRCVLRALIDNNRWDEVEIVAINDLTNLNTLAHLLKYDTTHGTFNADVKIESDELVVNEHRIKVFSERDPATLPWKTLGIDLVHECTGKFVTKEGAMKHVQAGAKKVLISAPGKNSDATIVYGVNHKILKATDLIVSNASCTTNCLAPMVKPLLEKLGLVKGLMVTTHAYTNDQVVVDAPHKDLRRARAAAQNLIPTKTGAAAAVGLVIPELRGLLDGYAIRVPTLNVSLVDLTFEAKRETNVEEVNSILKAASDGELKDVLAYNEDLLVSHDFNHNPHSSIFDSTLTKVIGGNLVKVSSWYDNEWGFSNRMIDTTVTMMSIQ